MIQGFISIDFLTAISVLITEAHTQPQNVATA